MQKIKIIAVGKLKEPYMRQAVQEYQKRLSRFCRLEIIETAESSADVEAPTHEAQFILPKLMTPKNDTFPLCIEGAAMDSVAFANLFRDKSEVTFVIGSSHGLADSVKSCGIPISFSKMTFPHQLMRVILLEQIYRGFKIINNEKYHK